MTHTEEIGHTHKYDLGQTQKRYDTHIRTHTGEMGHTHTIQVYLFIC